jgi:branched-chain amino acid transport system ATP-binding protein
VGCGIGQRPSLAAYVKLPHPTAPPRPGVPAMSAMLLENVSLHVAPGTIHAVIGPNGAGKTTLLNLVAGLYRPTTGRVSLAGEVLTGLPPHRIAAHGVARTFQNTELFVELTARENVLVGLHRISATAWQ